METSKTCLRLTFHSRPKFWIKLSSLSTWVPNWLQIGSTLCITKTGEKIFRMHVQVWVQLHYSAKIIYEKKSLLYIVHCHVLMRSLYPSYASTFHFLLHVQVEYPQWYWNQSNGSRSSRANSWRQTWWIRPGHQAKDRTKNLLFKDLRPCYSEAK